MHNVVVYMYIVPSQSTQDSAIFHVEIRTFTHMYLYMYTQGKSPLVVYGLMVIPSIQSIWCNHFTSHYELFVGVAILVQYKSQLMQCSTVESLMEVHICMV